MQPQNFLIRVFRVSGFLPVFLAGYSLLATQQNDPIVRRVDDHYNHLNSLRAHYTERYSGMGMDRSEEGTLLLKKPGRMRWNYANPAGKVFVLDGKFAWFYTPGDAQATRVPENSSTICDRRCVFCWGIRSWRRNSMELRW